MNDASGQDRSRAPLGGRVVELIPLGLARIDALYEIALVGGAGDTWRTRGRTVSLETFAAFLWEAGDCAFAVADRQTNRLAGFVGLYGHDVASGVASLSAFFDQRNPRAALVAGDALERFCGHAFGVMGLRKLTVEIPRPLSGGLAAAARRLPFLQLEGTLTAHARMGRELHDIEIYAVWADEFLAWTEPADRPRPTGVPARGALDLIRGVVATVTNAELPDLDGGCRLSGDLGLDSLAIIEILVGSKTSSGLRSPATPSRTR